MSNRRKLKQPPLNRAEEALIGMLEKAKATGFDPGVHVEPGKACPDCGAVVPATGPMSHDTACPQALALEAVCDADREWFLQHPDEESYTRLTAEPELAELRFTGQEMAPGGLTEVHKTPWGRIRNFHPPISCTPAEIDAGIAGHEKKCPDTRYDRNRCPCGLTEVMFCTRCGEPLFIVADPGTWCEHVDSLPRYMAPEMSFTPPDRARPDVYDPPPGSDAVKMLNAYRAEHRSKTGCPCKNVALDWCRCDTAGTVRCAQCRGLLFMTAMEGTQCEHIGKAPDTAGGPDAMAQIFQEMSPIEKQFWDAHLRLKLPGLSGLTPEYPVLGGKYRIDFALPSRQIGIELDGFATHSSTADITRDRQRQRELEWAGWHIIRFGGAEIHRDADTCVRQADALAQAREAAS